MPYIQRFFIFFLFVSNSLAYTQETENNHTKPIIITPYHSSDNSEKNHAEESIFSEDEVEELEFIFESAPKEAQFIVNHLQDPTFFPGNTNYRAVYFVGEPGTGKTTTAKSIAHEMSKHGWKYKFLSSTSLLKDYRNQTAIQLQRELQSSVKSGQPTILVLDEAHQFLENCNSKHHDTGATATVLWTFLDEQKNNPNFFFIGTMNRITHLPKPFKSRILFDYIEFQSPQDMRVKNTILRKHLLTKNSCIDPDVTDDFLNGELEKMDGLSARDLKNVSCMIHRIQRQENPTENGKITIQKASIAKAVIEYIRRKEKIQYDREDETDEERYDRYHNENMELQKKQHAAQMKIQKENQEIQQVQFVQQQKIQLAIADNQWVIQDCNKSQHYLSQNAFDQVSYFLSDEQKKLYNNSMKNTRAREAAEEAAAQAKAAAERAAAQERARIKAEEDAENSLVACLSRKLSSWLK